ncbi:MAG: LPS assembly lipoprotein LptE [Aureliella sp.]
MASLSATTGLHRLFMCSLVVCAFSASTILSGCASYQFGNRSLYNPNIRTVYIPQVRNDTFRHKLGPRLTEALVRAIELRTPYKVVASPSADSTLTCRLTTEFKRTVTEAITDEPRAIERMLTVQLTWVDRQGNQLMTRNFIPDGELAFYFIQGTEFVPEGGQSIATAEQRVIERLADEIVGQMETRW